MKGQTAYFASFEIDEHQGVILAELENADPEMMRILEKYRITVVEVPFAIVYTMLSKKEAEVRA